MGRALFLLLVAPLAMVSEASAQTGGIQVAPVMVVITGEDNISSVRLRNGRARPVAFEVDAYAWSQENGEDVLTPTRDLIVAPGVFEIDAGGEQVVRLGIRTQGAGAERSYRIVLRELPSEPTGGVTLGFTLEMSLPVFVSPVDARAQFSAAPVRTDAGYALVLANNGSAYVQIGSIENVSGGAIHGPRYLLPGSHALVPLPAETDTVRLRIADRNGPTEQLVHVRRADTHASVH